MAAVRWEPGKVVRGEGKGAGTTRRRGSRAFTLAFIVASVLVSWGVLVAPLGAAAAGLEQAQPALQGTQEARERARLVLLYQNDLHGYLEPSDAENGSWGGIARIAHIVQSWRSRHPGGVLWLDAGDAFHGAPLASLLDGDPVVDVLNAAGLDAMALGNHDFNFGQARLVELMEQARFPILSANTVRFDANAPVGAPGGFGLVAATGEPLAPPVAFFDVAGIRVAVLGLTTPNTGTSMHPGAVAGLAFQDPVAVAAAWVPVLRKRADLVIALTHIGYSVDRELAAAVPGIDVIVGGYTHTLLEGAEQVGDTLIVQAGEFGRYLGVLELTVEGGRVIEHSARLVPITSDVPAHPDVEALVGRWAARLTDRLAEPVGRTAVDLGGGEDVLVRVQETALANLIADAFRDVAGADIGFVNGGAVRGFIPTGPIRFGDLTAVLPFGGNLVVLELTGAELVAALEQGLRAYPQMSGGFLQVSGLTFVFDPGRPVGERVVEVKVGGEPVDYGRTYRVAVNDFLAAGGSGHTTLARARVYLAADDDGGISVYDAVQAYLEKVGEVSPRVEGRIRTVETAGARAEPVGVGQPSPGGR